MTPKRQQMGRHLAPLKLLNLPSFDAFIPHSVVQRIIFCQFCNDILYLNRRRNQVNRGKLSKQVVRRTSLSRR